jgi:hypothetical protein
MSNDITVLEKRPAASRLYDFDFAPQMGESDTITSITSITANPATVITLGTPTASGKLAQIRLGAGTDGVMYLLTAVVVTNTGDILQTEGYLFVRDAAY